MILQDLLSAWFVFIIFCDCFSAPFPAMLSQPMSDDITAGSLFMVKSDQTGTFPSLPLSLSGLCQIDYI